MAVEFFVNGRPVRRASDCDYNDNCACASYINRNKFPYNISNPEPKWTRVSLTIFNQDEIAGNLYTICENCKKMQLAQKQSVNVQSK